MTEAEALEKITNYARHYLDSRRGWDAPAWEGVIEIADAARKGTS